MNMTKEELLRYGNLVREGEQLRKALAAAEALPGAKASKSWRLLRRRYRAAVEAMGHERLAIEEAIEKMEPEARMIFRYRYLDGLGWEEVCDRVHYSWRQTHRLHAAALEELEHSPSP